MFAGRLAETPSRAGSSSRNAHRVTAICGSVVRERGCGCTPAQFVKQLSVGSQEGVPLQSLKVRQPQKLRWARRHVNSGDRRFESCPALNVFPGRVPRAARRGQVSIVPGHALPGRQFVPSVHPAWGRPGKGC